MQLEIWIWWVPDEQGPNTFAACMGLLLALPLIWRRQAPFACLAAGVCVLLVWTLVAVPQGSLFPLLTMLALTFSVAIHASTKVAVAGLALSIAVWVFFVARTTNDIADYGFIEAFIVAAWVAGRGIRIRELRAQALFRETVRLEVEREEKVREAAEHERSRIARELHDIISHSVSVMVVQAGAAEQVLDRDQAQVKESLRSIQDTGRQARLELRRLLGLMRADGERATLEPQPGVAQLPALAEQLRQSGLDVELVADGESVALSPGLDLAVYRVVQEALTNALKHGGPGRAQVSVRHGRDSLEIEVIDKGHAQPAQEGTGFGLIGMRERIALYGGELVHGPHNGGYRLLARFPLAAGDQQ
jgi:signal transduction histidine kinase